MPDRLRGWGRQLYQTTSHARWHGVYASHRATVVPADVTLVALFVARVDHCWDENSQLLYKSSGQCRESPVRPDARKQLPSRTTHEKGLRRRDGRGFHVVTSGPESG